MIVFPVIPLVFVVMIVAGSTMRMIVDVLMGMIMRMIVDVFMTMFHVSVGMLMGMRMLVFMVMLMIVFVFSFHHPSSCATFCRNISSDSMLYLLSVSQLFVNGLPDSHGILVRSAPKTGKKVTIKMGKRKNRVNDIYVFGILFLIYFYDKMMHSQPCIAFLPDRKHP